MKYPLTLIASLIFMLFSGSLTSLIAEGLIWGTVYTVDWSPDGSKIAVAGGYEGCDPESASFFNSFDIQVVNSETGELIRQLKGAKCSVTKVVWSPDNRKIAAISVDDVGLRVWNVTSGEIIASIQISTFQAIADIAWSPDSEKLAITSIGNSIVIVDILTGKQTSTHVSAGGTTVDWSPDGTKLLAGSAYETEIRVIDAITGQTLQTFDSGSEDIRFVAWNSDGSKFASASYEGMIKIWDSTTGNVLKTILTKQNYITDIAWNPDNSKLASSGSDGTVYVWDTTTGSQFAFYKSLAPIYDIDWNDAGNKLIYTGATFESSDGEGGPGGTYEIVDVPQNSMISSVSAIAWTPDGTQIAVGGWVRPCSPSNFGEAGVRFMDAATHQLTPIMSADDCTIGLLEWSADGKRLAALGDKSTIVWDVVTRQVIYQNPHSGYASDLAVSPDGQQIAQATIGGGYSVFNVTPNNSRFFRSGRTVDWSSDGTKILSVFSCGMNSRDRCDDQILITDAATGETIKTITFEDSEYVGQAIRNVDGSQFAANVITDGMEFIRTWDAQSYELLKSMPLDSSIQNIYAMIWSPNNDTLALIQGGENEVVLWDTQTGQQTAALAYPGTVFTAAWSPDGRQIAYGGAPDSSVTADLANGCEMLLDNTMIMCDVNRLELE